MNANLNHYKVFYEVARTGNISHAAKNLYLSQPAVSKSITKLEESLSQTLFIRSKQGVKLTSEGEMLYQHIGKAFESIENAENTLKNFSKLGMGQLRIGASTSLCKYILMPYLQEFIKQNPHVKISIACNPTYETLQLMEQDKIDIGLICETNLDKKYSFTPLAAIHDVFVASQSYLDNLKVRENAESNTSNETTDNENSLPNVTGLIMFNEFANEEDTLPLTTKEIIEKSNLMLLDRGNISRKYIDKYFEEQDIHPSQILEINNMDMLIDFATIGMGVTSVVKEFVNDYLETGQVTELSLSKPVPERIVGLVYNKNIIDKTAERFIDFCS